MPGAVAHGLLPFLGSLIGLLTVAHAVVRSLLPAPLVGVAAGLLWRLQNALSRFHYVEVPEYDDSCLPNELYGAIKLHLSANIDCRVEAVLTSARRLKLYCGANAKDHLTWSPGQHELVPISFMGTTLLWEHCTAQEQNPPQAQLMHATLWNRPPLPDEKRTFVLKLHKGDKNRVLRPYVDHILKQARHIRHHNRERLLYTNARNDSFRHPWDSVPFKHPSTFGTLALDPLKKRKIEEDLHAFANGEEFYRRTGRAWKRGYLLYGPPGTGKSSLIAAMANLLRYDVYDLELTQVRSNVELRKLLLRTTSKSIIVIEDIDCSLDLGSRAASPGAHRSGNSRRGSVSSDCQMYGIKSCTERSREGRMNEWSSMVLAPPTSNCSSMTLSGLLNFTDGLWSCCGNERIFVFTTNHIDSLDPALLRSGRMDMHIFMSHCTFAAFKILASNYLGVKEHPLFAEVEEAMEDAQMTPAEVSEILIRHRDRVEAALEELVAELWRQSGRKDNVACVTVTASAVTSPTTLVKEVPGRAVIQKQNASAGNKPWPACMAGGRAGSDEDAEDICKHSIEDEVEQVKMAVQDSSMGGDAEKKSCVSDAALGDLLQLSGSIRCPSCKHKFSVPEPDAGDTACITSKSHIFLSDAYHDFNDEEMLP